MFCRCQTGASAFYWQSPSYLNFQLGIFSKVFSLRMTHVRSTVNSIVLANIYTSYISESRKFINAWGNELSSQKIHRSVSSDISPVVNASELYHSLVSSYTMSARMSSISSVVSLLVQIPGSLIKIVIRRTNEAWVFCGTLFRRMYGLCE